MQRFSLMNILIAATLVGAALVGYNALVRGDNSGPNNATDKLRTYLSIDAAKQDAESNSTQQAQAPEQNTESNQQTPSQPAETSTEPTQTNTPEVAPAETSADSKVETVYTVKQGDTYGCIAEKYYGSYEHYVDIMASNPVRWEGFSERELHVDAKLILPAISKENLKPASSICS